MIFSLVQKKELLRFIFHFKVLLSYNKYPLFICKNKITETPPKMNHQIKASISFQKNKFFLRKKTRTTKAIRKIFKMLHKNIKHIIV